MEAGVKLVVLDLALLPPLYLQHGPEVEVVLYELVVRVLVDLEVLSPPEVVYI